MQKLACLVPSAFVLYNIKCMHACARLTALVLLVRALHLHFRHLQNAFGSSSDELDGAPHRCLCGDCRKKICGRRECISIASLLPHPPLRPGLLLPSAYWLFSGLCTSLHTPRTIGSSITLLSTWASFLTGAVHPTLYCKYHSWTAHNNKEL